MLCLYLVYKVAWLDEVQEQMRMSEKVQQNVVEKKVRRMLYVVTY